MDSISPADAGQYLASCLKVARLRLCTVARRAKALHGRDRWAAASGRLAMLPPSRDVHSLALACEARLSLHGVPFLAI